MKKYIAHLGKEFKTHTFDYLLLITAGIFFLLALNVFRGERFMIFITLLAFCAFYIVWGMYHHARNDSIRLKTVLEYIVIAFLILFLLKIIIYS